MGYICLLISKQWLATLLVDTEPTLTPLLPLADYRFFTRAPILFRVYYDIDDHDNQSS
jgi:hypothetical protein